MGENSAIAWTHHTFNPWIGCSKVSPACDHCYAEAQSKRLAAQHGLKLWEGDRYFTRDAYWRQPLKWNRDAEKSGARARVFCASFADVFEDRADLVSTRARLWDLIASTPHLDWLLLTKRPENIARMVPWGSGVAFWGNVWLGTTCEDQARADERIPELLRTGAAVRFVSFEPALGFVDFTRIKLPDNFGRGDWTLDATTGALFVTDESGTRPSPFKYHAIDWIIVGGESGPHARPFDLKWARRIVEASRAGGVAPFVKQLGAKPYDSAIHVVVERERSGDPNVAGRAITSNTIRLNDRKGGNPSEWPEDLRVQEFPEVRRG